MIDAHSPSADFKTNLAAIRRRLDAALKEAGRAGPVEIVAVSKTQDEAAIRAALAAGQRVFGENRVQEAMAAGRLGPSAAGLSRLKVTLHESHPARAGFEADLARA